VSSEGSDVTDGAIEIVVPLRLQGDGVHGDRHGLFAECEKPVGIAVDADVDRRLQHHVPPGLIARERSPETPVDEPTSGIFLLQLRGLDEAVREVDPLTGKAKCADHTVAIQPVLVTHSGSLETGRPIYVVRTAKPARDFTLNTGDFVRVLGGVEEKTAFQKGGGVGMV